MTRLVIVNSETKQSQIVSGLICPSFLVLYSLISASYVAGKSNLMDAISFVLGEKTQNLRVRNLKVM